MSDTLAAALVAFQAVMPTVAKGKKANVPTKTGGSYSYTYADLADVSDAALPVLGRFGLSFTSRPRRTDGGDYELEGLLLHTSGESSTGALPLFGRTPQELGSSITYARRYLLGCMTGIVTDDDDDANTANHAKRANPQQQAEDRRAAALTAAQDRVKAAWAARHEGVLDMPALMADFTARNGLDIREADADTLNTYAETWETQ